MDENLFNENGAILKLVRHRTDLPWRTWGNVPGPRLHTERALKARLNAQMNRAFSADGLHSMILLGRCPRLSMNAAPLALNIYVGD